ncbi:MAG: glycosyltransferase family 4 protein [Opitutaceae bacterium]
MHESSFSFSQIESPTAGTTLPQGQHTLRGWVMPKPGGGFVDVRARIGDRLFPGVHGFPRADLAAHFKTGRPVALAEFTVVVEVAPGPADVVLECLELEGRWSAFQTVSYHITPANRAADVATPSGPLRWHEYGRALQLLLWAQRREPEKNLAALAREIVAAVPYPRDLRHPHLPFHGHLDEPAAVTRCGFGRTAVLGYLFHETQPISRVLATFDLQAWQTIEHTQPSPGPAHYYPQFANAALGGLFGIIDVPAQLPNPVCLRLYAELPDGSLHLCSVQRSRLFTNEDEKAAYPPKDRASFPATHAALQIAFAERRVEIVHDDEMQRELARLAADFQLRAPAALTLAPALQAAPAISSAPLPKRILLVTHNLNLEGAPLFLVDYARYLAAQGAQLTVVSPADGPLRTRFEAFGAQVQIVDATAVFAAATASAAHEAIRTLAGALDFSAADLVVCNTFTTFWAVHAAKAAGRRVLLYVHESTTPASFYVGRMEPEVIALVDEAFGLADCVSFTTVSTRHYHLDYGRADHHRLTPGWIDVARIDDWRQTQTRDALRAHFNLSPGELLVTNVGSVCDRKGQHIFARAVDLLWRRYPELAARTRFVMLGGGDSPFDRVLADLLAQLNRANLVVHPGTPDYFPYYAAADLFVCSTYEESSPRVILECMACVTPILTSGVHGILEQVRPDLEAKLVPPGDTVALCEGMAQLLRTPALGATLAARARARVVAEFDAPILLPRHAALASAVAAGQI